MNQLVRFTLIVLAFILAVFSLVLMMMMFFDSVYAGMLDFLITLPGRASSRIIVIFLALFVLVVSVVTMVYGIMSGRLRRTRIRSTEIGNIDIGVDAIESIALNAAKSAQCGIKTAKARVAPFKGDKISIQISAVLYSDVEVPAMMAKVQDRIKKDVERYTGIQVAQVVVRVSRVEPVAARIER
ncbi:MAG: alkaline shock response membrane anchor protein AmaP [Clostridiaceae bacterium]|jgi:uncharacterized alkaline shock family protein YloU|nr:alkaline shock response membrane anchor protein AmaP [Clostridiaceae bacterium]